MRTSSVYDEENEVSNRQASLWTTFMCGILFSIHPAAAEGSPGKNDFSELHERLRCANACRGLSFIELLQRSHVLTCVFTI